MDETLIDEEKVMKNMREREKRDLTTTGNNIPATAERAAPSN